LPAPHNVFTAVHEMTNSVLIKESDRFLRVSCEVIVADFEAAERPGLDRREALERDLF
jgi:hypothetical protein